MDEVFSAMGHSNPNIRNEAILIISRFLATPKSKSRLGKSEIKVTCEKLLKVRALIVVSVKVNMNALGCGGQRSGNS